MLTEAFLQCTSLPLELTMFLVETLLAGFSRGLSETMIYYIQRVCMQSTNGVIYNNIQIYTQHIFGTFELSDIQHTHTHKQVNLKYICH